MNKKTAKFSNSYNEMWQSQQHTFFEQLSSYPLELHPDKHNIAFMLAGAALNCTDINIAKRLFEKACFLTQEPVQIQQFMLAALHIQFGKALLVAEQPAKALEKFIEAWQIGNALLQPLFYGFMCEAAEQLLSNGNSRVAIQAWQDIATVLQQATPAHVYHRMSHCYAVNAMGFGGTAEQNAVWGDCYKHDLLAYCHAYLDADFYFEIGVDEGISLSKATKKALGVDARPELNLKVSLPETATIIGKSSDAFFQEDASHELVSSPDLAFIDGMHLLEFALRDFINFERYSAHSSLVVIDDIFPCHPVQALRRRASTSWTGDVWKLLPILRKYRPDLLLLPLRAHPTGLLLVAGLDANNTVLSENYAAIIADYQADMAVPEDILTRANSVASDHACVSALLSVLKDAKNKQLNLPQLKKILLQLDTLINDAKANVAAKFEPEKIANLSLKNSIAQALKFESQLFLPQAVEPVYTEINSIRQVFQGEGKHTLSFKFDQALSNKPLRFDPANKPGLFEIQAITLSCSDTKQLIFSITGNDLLTQLNCQGDILKLKIDGRFIFYSFAHDPIIYLPCVELPEQPLELSIKLRVITDLAEQQQLWSQFNSMM